MAKTYYFPPIVILGPGAIELIVPEIQKMNVKKALVVTDKVLIEAGVVQSVLDVLEGAKIPYAIFSDVKPNPTVANVNAGYQALLDNECDFIVSIGGGSPQDTGKGVAILGTNPGDLCDYEGVGKTANKSLPIVAINTTAGTASEATINYVITDEKRKLKMVIVDPNSIATVAVNDPVLMLKMPKALTAATGMDALTHAVEGYTTAGATPFTDMYNIEAIRVIAANLRKQSVTAKIWMPVMPWLMASLLPGWVSQTADWESFTRWPISWADSMICRMASAMPSCYLMSSHTMRMPLAIA